MLISGEKEDYHDKAMNRMYGTTDHEWGWFGWPFKYVIEEEEGFFCMNLKQTEDGEDEDEDEDEGEGEGEDDDDSGEEDDEDDEDGDEGDEDGDEGENYNKSQNNTKCHMRHIM